MGIRGWSDGGRLPAPGADGAIPVCKDGVYETGIDKDPKGNTFAAQAGLSSGSLETGSVTIAEDGDTAQFLADGTLTINTQEVDLKSIPETASVLNPLITDDDSRINLASPIALTMTDNACTPDFSDGNDFEVTLTGADTINNPTNASIGQSGVIWINNSAGGTATVTWGTAYKFIGGVDQQVASGASSLNALAYKVKSTSPLVIACNLLAGLG